MFRFLITLIIVGVVIFIGSTVKLGKRTFFGHVGAIWSTPEAKDMREGVGEKAAPVVEKIERGVKAGVREATRDDPAGSGSGTGSGTGSTRRLDAGVRPSTR